jgi:hypothetical protein
VTIPRIDSSWPVLSTDWTAQLGSLLLGAGTPYRISAINGLGMPTLRTSDQPRAARHGVWGGLDLAGSRDITFEITIVPPASPSGLVNLLTAFLNAWSPTSTDIGLALRIPGLGSLVFIGRPRKVDAPFDLVTGTGQRVSMGAMFTATDPFKYSAALLSTQVSYGTSGTNEGLPFNAASYQGMTYAPMRLLPNGNFQDIGLTPWTAYHDTIATDATSPPFGSANLKCTNNDTFGAFGSYVAAASMREPSANWIPGIAGSGTITGSAYFRVSDPSVRARIYFGFPGAADVAGPWTTLVVNTWTRVTLSALVPVGASQVDFYAMFENYDGLNSGKVGLLDAALLEKRAVASPYTLPLMGATFGAVGGGQGSSGFGNCYSNGTELSAPVSRIYAAGGAITGPVILERVESGEDVIIDYSMNGGDVLELDHDLHSLTLNGQNRTDLVDVATSWWQIWPGKNTIHFRTASPSPGSYAQILWRDAIW